MNVLDLVADLVVDNPSEITATEHSPLSLSLPNAESRMDRGSSPLSPPSPRVEEQLHFLALEAIAELRADTGLRRMFKAEPEGPDRYVVAVAVRLDDGAIVSAVLHDVQASWEQLLQVLEAAKQDQERFDERAGVREFDAGQTRAEAEAGALLDIVRSRG